MAVKQGLLYLQAVSTGLASPVLGMLLVEEGVINEGPPDLAECLSNLLKFNYFRTTPPLHDWVIQPDFSIAMADYELHGSPTFRQQFRDCYDNAHMFLWLSGKEERIHIVGGQSWPIPARRLDIPYGVPDDLHQ